MTEETYTFQAPAETTYYTMHDGQILVPDAQGRVSTTNPAYASQLRILGATEVQEAPPASQEAAPEALVPDAAALEIPAEPAPEEEAGEQDEGDETPAGEDRPRRRRKADAE